MSRRAEFSILLGLLLAAPGQAADEVPDLALLEFLGEWEDGEGQWVDPLEFLEREGEQDGDTETSGEQNDDLHEQD